MTFSKISELFLFNKELMWTHMVLTDLIYLSICDIDPEITNSE